MTEALAELIQQTTFTAEEIQHKTRGIYDALLITSKWVDDANFSRIHPLDLETLYQLYDSEFFAHRLSETLAEHPLSFRLSRRMTKAGAKTARRELRQPSGGLRRTEYEIAVSTTLLFQTFQEDQRTVHVTGLLCRNRLEALQRVFEHELVHLAEMLAWRDSNCSVGRFQSIAERLFGHVEHTHQLVTPREHAKSKFGIQPGDRVRFRLDGRHHEGLVNRITRRATILVEDPSGSRYSDGRRYAKFYIPLPLLERVVSD